MTPLCELALKYGTDKREGGYTPFYHLLFGRRRAQVSKVLEVGIGYPEIMPHVPGYKAGASLRMWEEYFPNAEIDGLDINPNALVNEGWIRSFLCDATDPNLAAQLRAELGKDFDLIVDDGDHSAAAQFKTFGNLRELLAPEGVYIVEDAHPDLSEMLTVPHACISLPVKIGAGQCIVVLPDA